MGTKNPETNLQAHTRDAYIEYLVLTNLRSRIGISLDINGTTANLIYEALKKAEDRVLREVVSRWGE